MRLEMGLVHISDVRFGPRTVIDDHVLFIDRQELSLSFGPRATLRQR